MQGPSLAKFSQHGWHAFLR